MDVQKLQDMLAIVQQQRDQALNALVIVQAENAALRREKQAAGTVLTGDHHPMNGDGAAPNSLGAA